MKKFLKNVSPLDVLHEYQQRSSMDIDPKRIKDIMNTEDYPEAVAKLYRIISKSFVKWLMSKGTLELMLLKYTEYEILSFLKYDDTYTSLMKKSSLKLDSTRTQSLGIGVNIGTFRVALANLDRLYDLFSIAAKVVKKNVSRVKSP